MSQNKTGKARWRPRLRHRKSKGEWAEIAFMSRAIGLGFTVCKPYGENHPFDFIAFTPASDPVRVQVKSSWSRKYRSYKFKASASGRPYRRREVDFIAVLVVPEDVWYIIPRRELGRRSVATLSPHVPHSRARLEPYRDAWHLLRNAESRTKGAPGPDLLPLPALLDFCDLHSSF
jgi:hypothetical protein